MSAATERNGAGGRPLVKVCGVTSAADAVVAVELGADLLGLNFYPPSPRYLSLERAAEIARAVRESGRPTRLVGVFVDSPPEEIEAAVEAAGLDLVQLHGDEGPEETARWGERAIRVLRRAEPPGADELAAYDGVWGFLFDVPHRTLYGGTGEAWEFERLGRLPGGAGETVGTGADAAPRPRRVLVAGGVGPGNARRAAAAARRAAAGGPWGIDVCSRVESAPGVKDRDLMASLFEEMKDG